MKSAREKIARLLKSRRNIAVILLLLFVAFLGGRHAVTNANQPQLTVVPNSTLVAAIKQHRATLMTVKAESQVVQVQLTNGKILQAGVPVNDGLKPLLQLSRQYNVPRAASPFSASGGGGLSGSSILALLPLLLIGALVIMMIAQQRGGRGMKIEATTSTVDFNDIAGCGEVVEELTEVRDFLKSPKKYAALGAKVPKGVLLHGPPGTGKTLVAKAIASEAGIPFFSVSGSDFVEMYVGLGARRVRNLFKKAKAQAPCIIFIDEIDALGRARGGAGDNSSRESDQTLNALLVEMDGFEVAEHPVIIIGATNRVDHLDPALLRPGRFDRQLAVDPPDRVGRLEILKLHSKGKALGPDIDLEVIAAKSSGMTGAELANVLNEGAILAARRGAKFVDQSDLHDAFTRVVAGAKKQNRAMSEKERATVAYHEVGHALAAELVDSPSKVEQISVEPRGRSLGHMIFSNEEEIMLESKSQLEARLVVCLAGRAAEELVVKDITAGAQDDLQKSTRIATAMLSKLGMGQTLGLFVIEEGQELPKEVREEVKQFLAARYQEAKELLQENWELMEHMTQALLDEETISRKRFLELLGREETPLVGTRDAVAISDATVTA